MTLLMMEKNVSNNMDIYTPIEEAGKIIRERWANKELREAVEKKLEGDVPEILLGNGPHGLIWRCICTPDAEFERFLELCKKVDLSPVGLENTEDKFHSGNFTKYGLADLAFSTGVNKNLQHVVIKKRLIEFNTSGGKSMCDLKTLWGENLVDFHHFFLQEIFPLMKNNVIDISEWLKRKGGTPEKYYFSVLSLAVCHVVYFDDFDLLDSEASFVNEIVIPVFEEIKKNFGVKPIIVKISSIGEHDKDPYWWCYSKESKEVFENHVKTFKC